MKKAFLAILIALLLLLTACSGVGHPTDTPTVATDGHTDLDNDGYCDGCAIDVTLPVNFVAINDLHGRFADTEDQPGLNELTNYLNTLRMTRENFILLSSGDMWQGMAESNLTEGLIITEWMNEMDFLSMTLGNHEFDWGEAAIEKNGEVAEFPFLAINIYDRETNDLVDYCTPSVLYETSGLKIGIIGAIGDCYSSIAADKTEDVYFKVGDELTALVKAESDRLRALGADLIVYSLHDGYGQSRSGIITEQKLSSYYDIELSDGYVDLVFEAHTHQEYVVRDVHGVYHVQAGAQNEGIAQVQLQVNYANGHIKVDGCEVIDSSVYAGYAPSDLVDTILANYEEILAEIHVPLGQNAANRSSEQLEDLVARLYYEAGVEKWGQDYDIVLAGAFLQTRSPYFLSAGDVTYADLLSLFPFDNAIVLCTISGEKLNRVFLSGGSYNTYYEGARPQVDPNGTYYVVTDTYSSTYRWNGMTEVARYDDLTFARDLLAEYARAGGFATHTLAWTGREDDLLCTVILYPRALAR